MELQKQSKMKRKQEEEEAIPTGTRKEEENKRSGKLLDAMLLFFQRGCVSLVLEEMEAKRDEMEMVRGFNL